MSIPLISDETPVEQVSINFRTYSVCVFIFTTACATVFVIRMYESSIKQGFAAALTLFIHSVLSYTLENDGSSSVL